LLPNRSLVIIVKCEFKKIALTKSKFRIILLQEESKMRRVYFDRIAVDPEVMIGKPVFKGTRIPIYIVLDLIGDGVSEDEIIRIYPNLSKEDMRAAVKFASQTIDRRELYETA